MTTAEIIIIRRTDAGLTQKELADKMGISLKRIKDYELGKQEPIFLTYKWLVKVCADERRKHETN
jgi:transcriptional regulator with XRE-family HTH domain